jgi:hypothetical protein
VNATSFNKKRVLAFSLPRPDCTKSFFFFFLRTHKIDGDKTGSSSGEQAHKYQGVGENN